MIDCCCRAAALRTLTEELHLKFSSIAPSALVLDRLEQIIPPNAVDVPVKTRQGDQFTDACLDATWCV